MKNLFFRGLIFSFVLIGLLSLYGCSSQQDEVAAYNNSIVDIQQQMLKKAEDVANVLTQNEVDSTKAADEMEKVLADVQKSYNEFSALKVPAGGADLEKAMKSFFDVEVEGITNLVSALRAYNGKEKDREVLQNLLNVVDDFSKKENNALSHFDEVQQQVAARYGQTVQSTNQ